MRARRHTSYQIEATASYVAIDQRYTSALFESRIWVTSTTSITVSTTTLRHIAAAVVEILLRNDGFGFGR